MYVSPPSFFLFFYINLLIFFLSSVYGHHHNTIWWHDPRAWDVIPRLEPQYIWYFYIFIFFYTINVFCVRLWMEEQDWKGKKVGRGSRRDTSRTPNMFFFSNSVYRYQYHSKWPAPQNHKQVPPGPWTTPTGAQDKICLKPQLQGKVFIYLHIIYISIDMLQVDYTYGYHHHNHNHHTL